MKKMLLLVLIALVAMPLFSAGQAENKQGAVMGVSGLAGSSYPVMCVVSTLMDEFTDSRVIVQSSGGGTENIRLMKQGKYQMGYAESNVMVYGYLGINLFEGNAYENMRFVCNTYPLVFQAVVRKDSDFFSLADLKGESFSPGSAGSGDEAGWEEIFSVFGLKKSDLKWTPLSHMERAAGFKDKILECMGFETCIPAGSILEACANFPIRLLPIGGKEREELFKNFPWYGSYTIPPGQYNGQDEEIEAVTVLAAIMADVSLDPQIVEDWCFCMYEADPERVRRVHDMAKDISLENAMEGRGPVPFHEGAAAYYKKKGMLK